MRALTILAFVAFSAVAALIAMAFFYAPVAQCAAGCLTQKIFYVHVPSAYAMYIGVGACLIGSIGYLAQRSRGWDALAQAGAETYVLFAATVLVSGPLWGRKAWGHYWEWEPRLTTTLLAALIFLSYLVLRASGGEAERKFSAALAIMGAAIMPVIHYSVQLWRGQHPTVITRRGGGVEATMGQTLALGFVAFTLLAATLIWLRARQLVMQARLEDMRLQATSLGLLENEE